MEDEFVFEDEFEDELEGELEGGGGEFIYKQ